jgi:hypothetical protein
MHNWTGALFMLAGLAGLVLANVISVIKHGSFATVNAWLVGYFLLLLLSIVSYGLYRGFGSIFVPGFKGVDTGEFFLILAVIVLVASIGSFLLFMT